MRGLVVVSLVAVGACGGMTVDGTTTPDASADQHAPSADASPLPAVDASTTLDASVPQVSCEAGDYYVSLADDAGTHVLEGGCGDASVPSTSYVGCGHKNICIAASACGGGASIAVIPFVTPGSGPGMLDFTRSPDSGVASYDGTTVTGVLPKVGGAFSGTFAAGAVTGSFCVEARQP